jgi:hypothetical protein
VTDFARFHTSPADLLQATQWYPVEHLAALFGVPSFVAEQLFATAGNVTGADVLRILALDAGDRIDPAKMTDATIAAFQSKHPSY